MNKGDRIKKLRNELGLTLEEVAKKVGTSRQTIQRYESGEISNIPSDKIELLATVLKTSPAYIMGWEQEDVTDGVIYTSKDREHTLKAISELNAADFEFVQEFLQRIKK